MFATSIIEVFLLRYVIPTAISKNATSIKEKIDRLIDHLYDTRFKSSSSSGGGVGSCSSSSSGSGSSSSEFSVTDYFFISSYIAKKRPDIPEAAIGIIIIIITIIIIIIIIIISTGIQIDGS